MFLIFKMNNGNSIKEKVKIIETAYINHKQNIQIWKENLLKSKCDNVFLYAPYLPQDNIENQLKLIFSTSHFLKEKIFNFISILENYNGIYINDCLEYYDSDDNLKLHNIEKNIFMKECFDNNNKLKLFNTLNYFLDFSKIKKNQKRLYKTNFII